METRRKTCLQSAASDRVPSFPIKQEVEWQVEVLQPMDLVNQELQLGMEPLPSIKTEADFMSKNMETLQKRCLKGAAGAQVPNVIIKEDVEWLTEDKHAPVNIDSIESIESEDDNSLTRDSQTPNDFFKPTKTELTSDEEFVDEKKDTNAGSSTETNDQHILAPAHGQRDKASIADKERELSHSDSRKRLRLEPFLKCDFCPRTFKHKYHLRSHLTTHGEDGKFSCDLCEKTFSKKYILNRHKKVHTKQGQTAATFICDVCAASFRDKQNLRMHMLRKHLDTLKSNTLGPESAARGSESKSAITIEACEVCHCIYPAEYISAHMRLAHCKPKHKCEFCSRLFRAKSHLKSHLKTHATDGKYNFTCDICEKGFYDSNDLSRHMKLYGQKDHPKFHCEECRFSFKEKVDLKFHMDRQHSDKTPQLTPQLSIDAGVAMKRELISDEEFIDEGNDKDSASHAEGSQQPALAHGERRARVGLTEDSVTREVCLNSYPKELIETHMRITHGDGAYKCSLCPQVCKSKIILKRHISTHDKNRTRPFACEQCGVKLRSQGILKKHMINQHLNKSKPENNRKPEFNCEICKKMFYRKRGLKRHMETQHGLKEHGWTHAGVIFSCEVCGAGFNRKHSLQSHKRKHKAKTHPSTPDPITNCDSVHTKEELILDEEFLEEESNSTLT